MTHESDHEYLRPHLEALAVFLDGRGLSNEDALKLLIATAGSIITATSAPGEHRDRAVRWAQDMLEAPTRLKGNPEVSH